MPLHVQTGEPPLKKEVGAELGCVTPYIITPGNWSEGDMEYYADEIVAGLVHNAGHNCTKAEILVTDRDWPLRETLLAAIRWGALLLKQRDGASLCSSEHIQGTVIPASHNIK